MFEFNRQLIKYLNKARTQPKNAGKAIANEMKNNFNGNELNFYGKIIDTFQGLQAVQNLQQFLLHLQPTHSLIHSKCLDQAAQMIAQQKGRQGKTQNYSPKVIYQKIQQFGRPDGKIGELISLSASSPGQISSYFLIDDGLTSRKRRRMVLDPTYRYIGVGQAVHTQYQKITVILLAQILEQNDNYFLENSRLTQQMKKIAQSQASNRGSNINRQSSFRASQFY